MRWIGLLAIFSIGCSGSNGGGGSSGGLTEEQADALCREYCGNELMGPSCGPGSNETIEQCYNRCLEEYGRRIDPSCPLYAQCDSVNSFCLEEAMWERYGCPVSLECDDKFGDCNDAQTALNDCERQFREDTDAWCEQSCPDDTSCGQTGADTGNTWGRVCRVTCEEDENCPSGTHCIAPPGYCALQCEWRELEDGTEYPYGCRQGETCDDRGRCQSEEPPPGMDGCESLSSPPPGCGEVCPSGSDSECEIGTFCLNGTCSANCTATEGCEAGTTCNSRGRCVLNI